MSARAQISQTRHAPAEGGESPNAYRAYVTVDLRVSYPPVSRANVQTALDALAEAYGAAVADLQAASQDLP